MKTIRLSNKEAALLTSTIEQLVADDTKETYTANGKYPAWERSVYLSDVNCRLLEQVVLKVTVTPV